MKILSGLLIACLLTACSGKPKFPEERLQKVVGFSDVSLEFHIGKIGSTLRCEDSGRPPTEIIEYISATKLGYITMNPEGKNRWRVNLTDLGQSTLNDAKKKPHDHQTVNGCDSEQVDYPLAHKSLVNITNTTQNGKVLELEYNWKWVPTETGKQLVKVGLSQPQIDDLNHALGYQARAEDHFKFPVDEGAIYTAKAAFEQDGDRWKLLPK